MRRLRRLVEDLRQDARYAARLLWRNPLFALTAALVLSIGIGATTTIFTVANGLLLRGPAGTADPDRLADIYRTQDASAVTDPTIPYRAYLELCDRATRLEGVYAFTLGLSPISLRGDTGAERIFADLVTTNYFSVLGVPPAAGRLLSPHDSGEAGASPLVVLSHRFWTRRFNADPHLIGTTLTLNGQSFTVIGVAADSFTGTSVVAPDVWVPIGMASVISPSASLSWTQVLTGGRLRPGVSFAEANAEIDIIGRTVMMRPLDQVMPKGWVKGGRQGLRLTTASPIPGGIRVLVAAFLTLLIGLVSIVLIIACANIAGVLLARAAARRREIAVRLAIGAGRGRLVRQLLTETVLLFLLGGAAGLLLARGLTSIVLALLPAFQQPVTLSLPLDGRVVAFTLIVSLIAAMLSGLAPALQASKTDVLSSLNADQQGPVDRLRLRSAFVIAQVALSILLVVAAVTLARAVQHVALADQGYDAHGVESVDLDLSLAGYTPTTGTLFVRTLLDRVRALPGVQSATTTDMLPSASSMVRGMIGISEGLVVPGMTPPNGLSFFPTSFTAIEPGYFATLRLPLVAGRDFSAADRADSPQVVILTESTARRLWPGQDAVGKYLIWQKGRADMPERGPVRITRLLVVGVARDLKNRGPKPSSETQPLGIYAPFQQRYAHGVTLLVRTIDGHRPINELRTLLATLNPNLPIINEQTLEQQLLTPPMFQLQVASSICAAVGLIGLLLAAIGLYGVTAYHVARRTREIGIRIALGAERSDVVGMVLRQGMTLVGIGSVIGLLLAAGAGRLMRATLFGLPAVDPLTFGGAAILFAAIGLAACYIPARRATQVDAIEALRYE